MFVEVAAKTTFNNSILTYETSLEYLVVGESVIIPLRKREISAIVTKLNCPPPVGKFEIKQIIKRNDQGFSLSSQQLNLFQWIANYYHFPLGLLIADILPKYLKRPRPPRPVIGKGLPLPFQLNDTQQEIIHNILTKGQQFHQNLIHGITGSGKTAIYLKLIQEQLAAGRSALFLLPEINLTPQFTTTLGNYLNCPIYTYHSAISNSEKFALWNLSSEQPIVVLGVRSSIFLPLQKLGLIIVDEEHDASFKQEERCPYNARDIAIKKAQLENIPIVLGSATPSFETYYRLKDIKDAYFKLDYRIGDSTLPKIQIVSNCNEKFEHHGEDIWPLSKQVFEKIQYHLQQNQQVLIFLNRLGHSNYIMCPNCGHQFTCPNCSTTLRYFKKREELHCHICDYKEEVHKICPNCGNMTLRPKGFGTELLEEKLSQLLAPKKVARLDRDEIKTMSSLTQRLDEFHQHQVDILIGTQMISKGHNFKNVNLVIILSIDGQLNYPDYRANERVYQLLQQVAGRSGRFSKEGEVVIQTYSETNPLFDYIANYKDEQFYTSELEMRKLSHTPPFCKMASIYITSFPQAQAIKDAQQVRQLIDTIQQKHFKTVTIFGPKPSLIEKKKNQFTWNLLLKSENYNDLHNLIETVKSNLHLNRRTSLRIDVDPYCIY